MQRVALFTDSNVMLQEFYHTVKDSLVAAGADVVVYDATLVEPTDSSLRDAIDFAVDVNPDGFVSLGGGSTMDTCKAARKSIYCFCFFSTVALSTWHREICSRTLKVTHYHCFLEAAAC